MQLLTTLAGAPFAGRYFQDSPASLHGERLDARADARVNAANDATRIRFGAAAGLLEVTGAYHFRPLHSLAKILLHG